MVNRMSSPLPKGGHSATLNLTKCHLDTEDENSTETDTKTSKHREQDQNYRLGTEFFFQRAPLAAQASLCLTWSGTPKTGIFVTRLRLFDKSQINFACWCCCCFFFISDRLFGPKVMRKENVFVISPCK